MNYSATEETFPKIRRLPFQDNIHTSIFTPREYQVELLDSARRRNLTACLGNAPSKAFLTVMLIREIAHEIRNSTENKSKWIVVVFTTVRLIQQYAEKIRDHTDLLVGEYIDNVEMDDWKELQSKQVLVITVQLFLQLLSKQVLHLSNINLVIVGESHHAAKLEHPTRKLMDILKQSDCETRVLGLSASIMKNQCDEPHLLEMYMNRLERTMGGVAETTSDMVSLSRFGNRFNELVVECIKRDNTTVLNSSDCLTLDKKIRSIVEPAIEFITDHVYRPEEIYGALDEDLNIPDPKIIPKFYLNELLHLLTTLGPWSAHRAALRFLKELKKHKDDTPYERHYLLISMVYTIMDMVHAICDYHFRDMTEVEKILKFSSPKIIRLLEILKYFKPLDSNIVPQNCKNNESKLENQNTHCNAVEANKILLDLNNVDDSNKANSSEIPSLVSKLALQDVKDDVKSLINLVSNTVTNSENSLYSTHHIIASDSLTNDTIKQKNLKNEQLENSVINTLNVDRQIHSNVHIHNELQKEKYPAHGNKHDNYNSGNKREYGNKNRMLSMNVNVDDPNSLCGLVFVDKRNTACIMHLLLKELSRHHDDFRFIAPNFLVGHTKSPYQQSQQQNENREVMLEHRKQEEVLRRFRLRECNLLVATNVLQDGIDIPKCNLVVRFDLPKDYRSYVQCKGRARATTSHLVHLVESPEKTMFIDDLSRFKTVEEVLLNRCHEREIPTDEELNHKETDLILPPYCPNNKESGAKVTMFTAISLVNRYCAKLPSDTFTRLTPRCQLIEKKSDDKSTFYQALLFLPINSPVKHPVIGPIMKNKALAKMAAALKMCKVLHFAGELDNNLLPVGKESVQQEDELMDQWEEEVIPEGAPKPGTTKRRQYYFKRIASAFINCAPKSNHPTFLYVINMKLTCPIPEEQNTRGRRIYAPEETSRCFGILTSKPIPKICGFPVFTRSGEVTVTLKEIGINLSFDDKELSYLSFFHNFTFSRVLRLEKYPMKFDPEVAESSFFIVPLNQEKDTELSIDWEFLKLIYSYQHFRPHFISDDDRKDFSFDITKYQDSVVMPWYRNLDQPQYFYVAEICYNLNPKSDFPDDEFETFEKYYFKKYSIQIQNLSQPLLDVDHTSARLNLLTPRYVNRKGVALPTSSEETKRAKRENLQQKQILVPELCTIHPFPASFWRKAVCLPCVLYRINCLLIAEQLRVRVAAEIGLGLQFIDSDFKWPILDFGWSLADVLKNHAENKAACIAAAESQKTAVNKENISSQNMKNIKNSHSDTQSDSSNKKKSKNGWDDQVGSKFDIGTWSNDMAAESSDMNDDKFDSDMGIFKGGNWPGNIMMLNDGGIFGDEPELESINEKNMNWTANESKNEPCIRYGSPSNFEDMGWDFDSSEEIGVMNIPGFSFISAPNLGFNLEDLSRDIEAYEEDGIYQEMQSETFDDEEEKNDYSTVSCWDGNSEINNENHNVNLDNKTLDEVDEDVSLEWIVSDVDSESLKSQEESSKEHFASKMKEKMKTINVVEGNKNLHLVIGESNSSRVTNKDETVTNPVIPQTNSFISSPAKSYNHIFDSMYDIARNDLLLDVTEYSKYMSFITPNCDSAYSVESAPYSGTVIQKYSPGLSLSLLAETEADVNKPFFSFDEQTSLVSHPGPSPSIILQALTMSNANDGINLERLETIGDSYLKHAITTYLYCTYPNIHEGKLSYLRSKQVSNLNLYRLGKLKCLGECMVATKFEPNDNWLPPGYFVPKELEQALIDSGIPAGHWNIANLPDLNDWKDLDAEQIRKALVKPSEDDSDTAHSPEISDNSVKEGLPQQSVSEFQSANDLNLVPNMPGTESNPEDMTCFIPYNLMTQHSIPDKSIADCVEALIGAYLTSCGPRGALLFMSWLGIKVLPRIKNNEDDDDNDIPRYGFLNPPPSPLLRIVENPELELQILLNGYEKFEEKIGYYFRDKSYLLQAFTHASYHYNRLTDCYQRLEFLGDAVLDYLITRHLYEDPRQHSPGTLTDLRSALVNNTIFATLAVKCDFHKYFKAICPGLFVVIDKFVKMQKENNHKLNEEYYFIEEDECEEAEDIEVPKALGDVFESVAGAIYLDSDMSLDTVWRVYYSMMKNEIEQFMTNVPKSPIRELLEMEPETAKFGIPEKTLDGKVRVTVEIFGKGKFRGLGRNYRIAKCTAAKHALKALKRMQGYNSC